MSVKTAIVADLPTVGDRTWPYVEMSVPALRCARRDGLKRRKRGTEMATSTESMEALKQEFFRLVSALQVRPEDLIMDFTNELIGPERKVSLPLPNGSVRMPGRTEEPPAPLEMSNREEAGLKELGLDPRRIRLAARSLDPEHYEALKLAEGLS